VRPQRPLRLSVGSGSSQAHRQRPPAGNSHDVKLRNPCSTSLVLLAGCAGCVRAADEVNHSALVEPARGQRARHSRSEANFRHGSAPEAFRVPGQPRTLIMAQHGRPSPLALLEANARDAQELLQLAKQLQTVLSKHSRSRSSASAAGFPPPSVLAAQSGRELGSAAAGARVEHARVLSSESTTQTDKRKESTVIASGDTPPEALAHPGLSAHAPAAQPAAPPTAPVRGETAVRQAADVQRIAFLEDKCMNLSVS
jgi:hypothetical protein